MKRDKIIAYVAVDAATGGPITPAGWDTIPEDSGWHTVFPLGRDAHPDIWFSMRLAARSDAFTPPRGCYVCGGAAAVLQRLADFVARQAPAWDTTWPDLAALRADNTQPAAGIKQAWQAGDGVTILWRMAGYGEDDAEP